MRNFMFEAICAVLAVLVTWAALIAILATMSGAWAHEWYEGSCCNERDCSPALDGDVVPTEGGYRINSLGITVPYGSDKVRFPSPDGRYHICLVPSSGALRCLYPTAQGS